MGILDRFRLDDRVAVITGASSGLGAVFATALAEAGADVVLGARRTEKLEDTRKAVEELGRRVVAVATDVAKPEDCQALVDAGDEPSSAASTSWSTTPASAPPYPATKETPEQFRAGHRRQPQRLLLDGAGGGEGHARPAASIVNVSSILALTTAGLPQAAYSASKAGLIGLTRDLAQQWTPRKGIRVNALAPGFFTSEMTDSYAEGYLEKMMPRVLVGRIGDPEELAAALVFLVSDAGSYVTGTTLTVDGGVTQT